VASSGDKTTKFTPPIPRKRNQKGVQQKDRNLRHPCKPPKSPGTDAMQSLSKYEKTSKSSAKGRKKKSRKGHQTSAKKVQNVTSPGTLEYSVNLLEISTAPSDLDSEPHSSSPNKQKFCSSSTSSDESLLSERVESDSFLTNLSSTPLTSSGDELVCNTPSSVAATLGSPILTDSKHELKLLSTQSPIIVQLVLPQETLDPVHRVGEYLKNKYPPLDEESGFQNSTTDLLLSTPPPPYIQSAAVDWEMYYPTHVISIDEEEKDLNKPTNSPTNPVTDNWDDIVASALSVQGDITGIEEEIEIDDQGLDQSVSPNFFTPDTEYPEGSLVLV
jgi:hypothetical protein